MHGQIDLAFGHGVSESRAVLAGELAFASAEAQAQRTMELLGDGALVVTLAPPPKDARGRLHELIDDLVERELARLGAPSPYLAAWSTMPEDADERLSDQLFRARTVGATGIAFVLGSLANLTSRVQRSFAGATFTPEDSATLTWLARTTARAPIVVLLDDADTRLAGYAKPVRLDLLLDARAPAPAPRHEEDAIDETPVDAVHVETNTEPPAPIVEDVVAAHEETATAVAEAEVAEPVAEPGAVPTEIACEPPSVVEPPTVEEITAVETTVAPAEPERAERRRRASAGIPVVGPSDQWRSWAIALAATRGPQTLATFERLFAESYVPLANAIASGLDDARALRAYDEFRRAFERSYTDASATFALTNRRPRLVMDAHDVAAKQARLHNARSTQVLVVDSLRYDLGCKMREALARAASGALSLTSETLLWSVLPTTTIRQLETFARGMDALRAPANSEEPMESLRGRSAEIVRRLRVGSRELYKLDIVPGLLATAGLQLDTIANATAEALGRYLAQLPPRTLVLVIGDHGFTVDRRGQIQTGGASPEEVLVPAQSWLVGELH